MLDVCSSSSINISILKIFISSRVGGKVTTLDVKHLSTALKLQLVLWSEKVCLRRGLRILKLPFEPQVSLCVQRILLREAFFSPCT